TELLPGPNPGPVTVAESAFGFAMLPRTQLPRRAMPLPSVVVTGDVSAPSPPVTTNVTLSPAIGSPSPSRTSTDGTVGTAAPASAAWLVPALMMILGAIRVSVTDTVREATFERLELTVTVAECVPVAKPAMFGVKVSVAGAVAPLSAAESQPVASPVGYVAVAASPESVPLPPFVTSMFCVAGFAPPVVPVKDAVVAESTMLCPTPTTNVTVSVAGAVP